MGGERSREGKPLYIHVTDSLSLDFNVTGLLSGSAVVLSQSR